MVCVVEMYLLVIAKLGEDVDFLSLSGVRYVVLLRG